MNKSEIESRFRYRKTLVKNIDKIIGATKASQKADLSSHGQLDLFSMGLEDVKSAPKLEEYDYPIDIMECVNEETEVLGVPVFYNPLDDLWMYNELFCTHNVDEFLSMTEQTNGLVYMDRVAKIETKVSGKGNTYCKIYTTTLGPNMFFYLWGEPYRSLISSIFIDEIYLFEIDFNIPTKEFDQYSTVVKYLKNIKDVDIEKEYTRLINSSEVSDLNADWQIKNRRNCVLKYK